MSSCLCRDEGHRKSIRARGGWLPMAAKVKAGKARRALIRVALGRAFRAWELGPGRGGWNPVVGALASRHGPFRGPFIRTPDLEARMDPSTAFHTVDLFLLFRNFLLPGFAQLHFLLPLLLPFNSLFDFFPCFSSPLA